MAYLYVCRAYFCFTVVICLCALLLFCMLMINLYYPLTDVTNDVSFSFLFLCYRIMACVRTIMMNLGMPFTSIIFWHLLSSYILVIYIQFCKENVQIELCCIQNLNNQKSQATGTEELTKYTCTNFSKSSVQKLVHYFIILSFLLHVFAKY